MSDTLRNGSERPDGWPELFQKPPLDCNHAYHWDDAEGVYVCMFCEDSREEPPESKRDVDSESL